MVKSMVEYFISLFIGLVLIRLAFGQRLDRHFLVWFAGRTLRPRFSPSKG